jgi:hypothetical protein
MQIAGDMSEPSWLARPKDILDELRPSLAKLRYEKYQWKPTAEETEKLRGIVMAG